MKCTNLLFWIYFCHGVTHRCLGGVKDPEPYKPCSCRRMENHVFQKLYYSVHATTRANLSPLCCPSYAKHIIFHFLYFLQSKKFKNLILKNILSLCQALGPCQWVRKVSKQEASDEWAKKGKHLINKHHSLLTNLAYMLWFKFSFLLLLGMVMCDNNMIMSLKQKKRKFEPRIKLNHNIYTRTMLTGYTYMYLSPSQLPCLLHTTFLDKLSLLSWSLDQAKKILVCASYCKLQILWWLKCCM